MTWPFGELPKMHFGVILADPPWRFQPFDNKDGHEKSASKHYRVMDMDWLRSLPVFMLGTDDSVLVMWATQAQLDDAMELMKVWGYTYKTAGAWAKRSKTDKTWAFGTGYIFRSAAEFFLVGTMGSPRSAVRDVRNLIVAPVREHSRKPQEMHVALERMFPDVPKCELFSRESRPGWSTWGAESTKFDGLAA